MGIGRAGSAAVTIVGGLALLTWVTTALAQPSVEPRSGQLISVEVDLRVPAGPATLEVVRVLDPAGREAGLLGRGWRLNWDDRVAVGEAEAVHDEAGVARTLTRDQASGAYTSTSGERLTRAADGRFVVTRPDGSTDVFDAAGRLVEQDATGPGRVLLRYAAGGRLAAVTGPFGASLRFDHDAAGRVIRIEASTGALVRYGYAGDRLETVETPAGPDPVRYRYDARGRLVRIEHPRWGVTELGYDARGRVTARGLADGSRETWTYDDAARQVRHVDPRGGVTVRQWSADGRQETLTDALGRTHVTELDGAGRPVRLTGPTGRTAVLAYDALGRLVATSDATTGAATRVSYLGQTTLPSAVTGPDGTREEFEYDAQRNLVRISRNGEVQSTISYLPTGLVERILGRGGRERRLTYDAAGRLASETDALGRVTRFEYDPRGNTVRQVDPRGGMRLRLYDAHDRVVAETNPLGATTRFEYDRAGRLLRTVDPTGLATRFEYDATGARVATIDAAGRQERDDVKGRLLTQRRADGSSERLQVDALGQPAELIDAVGRTTRMSYDALGRLQTVTRPSGLVTTLQSDDHGRTRTVEDGPGGRRTFLWDGQSDRLAARVDPTGAIRRFRYDPAGRLVATQDEAGGETRLGYDGADRLTRVEAPGGETAGCDFDAEDRLRQCRDAAGRVTRFEYDPLDNVVAVTGADGGVQRFVYDAAGRRTEATDAAGKTTRFDYDAAGRLLARTDSTGRAVRYAYDASGALTGVDDGAYPLRYEYDAGGRLTGVGLTALGRTVRYGYDAQGRPVSVTGTAGQAIRYRHDPLSRVVGLGLPGGAEIALSYDTADRLRGIRYPNGVVAEWRYDAAGRVERLAYQLPPDTAAGQPARELAMAYAYDVAGNPVERRRTEPAETRRYRYDAAGRLAQEEVGAETTAYTYRPGGDRAERRAPGQTVAYAHDTGGRLTSAGGEQLTHDATGRVVRRDGPGGSTRYTFDDAGRLTAAATPAGTVEFGYAATGERIWRRGADGTLTRFVHDGGNLLEELAADGQLRALYVHAPGVDRPLAMIRDGQVFYYHADALGSILAMTDTAGRVVATYDTDAFGVVARPGVAAGSPATASPFVFAGREYEPALGLHYLRARYYDPALGRFLSPDPLLGGLDDPASLNRYAYALNVPTRYVDGSGLAVVMGVNVDYAFLEANGIRSGAVNGFIDRAVTAGYGGSALQQQVNALSTMLRMGKPPDQVLASMAQVRPPVAPPLPAVAPVPTPPPPPAVAPPAAAAPAGATAATLAPPAAPPPGAVAGAAAAERGLLGQAWEFLTRARGPFAGPDGKPVVGPSGSVLGDTAKGAWLGAALAGIQAAFDPTKTKGDVAWAAGTGATWGAAVNLIGEGIKQATIKAFGNAAGAALTSATGVAGIALVTAATGYQLNEANNARLRFEKDVLKGIEERRAFENNPLFTDESVRRLLVDLQGRLAVLRNLHGQLTAAGGADPATLLAGPQAKLGQLQGMANPDPAVLQRSCGSVGPLAARLRDGARAIEGKARDAVAQFGAARAWPAARPGLEQAYARMTEAAQLAGPLKPDGEALAKALEAIRLAGPDGLQAATKLHTEILAEVAAVQSRLAGQAGPASGSDLRAAFNGTKADLMVRVRARQAAVPGGRFPNAWADFNDVLMQALALPAPGDPGAVGAEAARITAAADVALQGLSSGRASANPCPGLTDTPAKLEADLQAARTTVARAAAAMLAAAGQRLGTARSTIDRARVLINANNQDLQKWQQNPAAFQRQIAEATQSNREAEQHVANNQAEVQFSQAKLGPLQQAFQAAGLGGS